MVSGIAAGAALAMTSWDSPYSRVAWIAGAGFIQLRLLANMFDGMVAIESGRVSAVGETTHFCSKSAFLSTRYVVEGLTATTSASSIM
jgi:hypothetical protein